MKLFDLHCDTLGEIFRRKEGMFDNSRHIELNKAFGVLESYTQVMAIWSEHDQDNDENFSRCLQALDYADKHIFGIENFTPILAVEGGKLLNGDISRLDALAERGVKIFTLVWRDSCHIGGAFNNHEGLTDFGKEVVRRCFELGITPDLSHSNDEICYQAIDIAKSMKKPLIASHSCSRSVYNHPRNVSDGVAREVAELGGVIGVNFVSDHLGSREVETVVSHIDRLRNVCGESAVCLGTDFDGTTDDTLPYGIENIGKIGVLYDALVNKYRSEDFADAVFCKNAEAFAKSNF
jgi:membrane dipeptidase